MSLGRCSLVVAASVVLVLASACGGNERAQRATPVSPSPVGSVSPGPGASAGPAAAGAKAPTVSTATSSSPPATLPDAADEATSGARDAASPPRDQPLDFRIRLEERYRDQLRRQPSNSFVDLEGNIVWTQEYLRYRVNACDHAEAVARVFRQLDGQGIQPVCGAVTTIRLRSCASLTTEPQSGFCPSMYGLKFRPCRNTALPNTASGK